MQNLRIPFILHCLTGGLDFRASKAGPFPQAWVLYAAPIAGNRWWMGSKRSLSGKVKRKNVPTRWVNWVPPLSQRQWDSSSSRLPFLPSQTTSCSFMTSSFEADVYLKTNTWIKTHLISSISTCFREGWMGRLGDTTHIHPRKHPLAERSLLLPWALLGSSSVMASVLLPGFIQT